MKLPKTLYVKIEQDGDAEYYVTADKIDDLVSLDEKVKVGTYQLTELAIATTTVTTEKVKS